MSLISHTACKYNFCVTASVVYYRLGHGILLMCSTKAIHIAINKINEMNLFHL